MPRPTPEPADPPPRPRLVVSRCLDLDACRYNGARIRAPLVTRLAAWVELVPVCPEVAVGLGVPRDPIRLVREGEGVRLVQPSSGRDLTAAMARFAARFLAEVGPVDGFLLKGRSPSCGLDDVKVWGAADGREAPVERGAGRFASAVLEAFPHHPSEDEVRLADPAVLDHFLTALFALAALREARRTGDRASLEDFHARHKLVLMACSPAGQKALGRRVAEGGTAEEAWEAYAPAFCRTLRRRPTPGTHANALQHAAGYFKDRLTPGEKARFLELLDRYRAGDVPRRAPLELLRGWVRRLGDPWLERQAYLAPYPEALADGAFGG